MIQALHAILGQEQQQEQGQDDDCRQRRHRPKVTLLYGNRQRGDILAQELLDGWAQDYGDQLTVHYILSQEPTDSDWTGLRGRITKDVIVQHFPTPSKSDKNNNMKDIVRVLVCGPPSMYQSLSGPREESDQISGALAELGYMAHQVYKF